MNTPVKKRGRGRPRYERNDETAVEVRAYARVGTTHKNIALMVGIALETLLKYYDEELQMGKALGVASVSKTLYECAMAKQPWAVCFYLKAQGGWRETSVVQSQTLGADGSPVDPPKLGISFEDGGPGRVRAIPYDAEHDDSTNTPPGKDKLN